MDRMPCSNTAALERFERQQLANEYRYEQLAAQVPESELIAEAEDRMWQDFGYLDGLTDHAEIVTRLALYAAGCADLLPADYTDRQKTLDEAWLWTYTRGFVDGQYDGIRQNWIEDHWRD